MPSLISVVIPTYNRADELRRALRSLASQTSPDFDVVVCDDGSQEDIAAVCAEFASVLDIQCVRIENSGGPARPRNVAAGLAKGPWISLLDSDDWWLPTRIEAVLPLLTDDVDVVYHPLIETSPAGEVTVRGRPCLIGSDCGPDPLFEMLRRGNPVPTSGCVVRRAAFERIGGFSEAPALVSVEDFDAWLRLAESGSRFRFLATALGYYWRGEGSISIFSQKQFERQKHLFERHLSLLSGDLNKIAASRFNYLLGAYAQRLGRWDDAERYLAQVPASVVSPDWWKSLVKRCQIRLTGKAS